MTFRIARKAQLDALDVMTSALMSLDVPEIRGRLNSTFEDEYRPAARKLIQKLKQRGYRLSKIRH